MNNWKKKLPFTKPIDDLKKLKVPGPLVKKSDFAENNETYSEMKQDNLQSKCV